MTNQPCHTKPLAKYLLLKLRFCVKNLTYQNPCFAARLCLLCSLFDETAQKHAQKATQNLQQSYKIHSKVASFNSQ